MISPMTAAAIDRFGAGQDTTAEARRIGARLFERAHDRGRRGQRWGDWFGRGGELRSLDGRPAAARRTVATVIVPLDQIVGSEGRSDDFDADFNPLQTHTRERWIGIAAALRMGLGLPPVELVQAGDGYYVRDGHHRISVAKALGQLEIEARIVN